MSSVVGALVRLGLMGFLGTVVVLTLAGLAVYGFVDRPDHDLTAQLFAALIAGAGGVLAAVGGFFKQEGGGDRPYNYNVFEEQPDILLGDLEEREGEVPKEV